jgi:hypothetical protein
MVVRQPGYHRHPNGQLECNCRRHRQLLHDLDRLLRVVNEVPLDALTNQIQGTRQREIANNYGNSQNLLLTR